MKEWIKRYGVHFGICVLIVGLAFVVNTRINIKRSHIYTVSEPVYTILKGIDPVKKEKGKITFIGWGFDTEYYNEDVKNEIILQDTETGEAIWPKMEKNSEPVEISDRYTDGKDYSKAGFTGRIRENQLKRDSVYEILLRYSCSYRDEAGAEQSYVRTVTTDEFLYQGEMTEYNPKTFVAPEIAGTELEKELEGARLFHYFPERMWIYYDMPKVYYVAEKSYIDNTKPLWFPCFWEEATVVEQEDQVLGKGLVTFPIIENEKRYETIERYRVWCSEMPSEKIIRINTGLYLTGEEKWILNWTEQIKEGF